MMTDAPDAFRVELRTARKQHHCCECPAPIVKGEVYQYSSGVWDGRGASFKTCMPCAEVREDFLTDLHKHYSWQETSIFGHLQSEIEEFY
jgi:hypothetical protein